MMRLVVAGDSLGLPRFAKGLDKVDLYYEDTYPEHLRRYLAGAGCADVMLINLCRHAQTSLHLVRGLATDVYLARPHAVIVELGLADLWPSRGRHASPPPYPDLAEKDPWVDAAGYRRNMELFLGFCRNAMGSQPPLVVLVNLWTVSADQYRRYPEALSRTRDYNAILTDLAASYGVELFDAAALGRELGPDVLCGDGIHWSSSASQTLARRLGDLLLRRLPGRDIPAANIDSSTGPCANAHTPKPNPGVRHDNAT
jgi:hypothetical protein